MCKAKSCKYWKDCLVRRECTDSHCADYEKRQEKPKQPKR